MLWASCFLSSFLRKPTLMIYNTSCYLKVYHRMGFFSMIYAVFMRFSCCFPASKITFSRMDFNGFPFSLKCSLIIILLFPMTKYWSWEVAFCSIKSSLFRGIPKWVTVCLRISFVAESHSYRKHNLSISYSLPLIPTMPIMRSSTLGA